MTGTAATSLFHFDNTYARLPDRFYARLAPTPVREPRLIRLNVALAEELGLDPGRLASPEGVAVLAGNRLAQGSDPIAQAYAGHQFGGFVPQLGDGRAILIGEVVGRDGLRRDIQLKGSGPTPFSRRGDGRAALGPVLREYIVAEAMAALGIPTTRALAVVATGEHAVSRDGAAGRMLTRIAASHIRVGTFQYFAARGDAEGVKRLADYAIERHYPEARAATNPYRAFVDAVITRQARLLARWLSVGFVHGVMNTDNCSIAGETIDYGPCAFMDGYDPGLVLSSIDEMGRYAYGNQPRIAQWNLARLAETLLPLLADGQERAIGEAQAAIDAFPPQFEAAYLACLAQKLGLTQTRDSDIELAQSLLQRMAAGKADFTLVFRRLADAAVGPEADAGVGALFDDPGLFAAWAPGWRARIAEESVAPTERRQHMLAANPAYIPRNHLVEETIAAAVQHDDFAPFQALVEVSARPFEEQPGRERYALPPRPEDVVRQTFCGT